MTYSEELNIAIVNYCKSDNKIAFIDSLPANIAGGLRRILNDDRVNEIFHIDSEKLGFKHVNYLHLSESERFVKAIDFIGSDVAAKVLIEAISVK